MINWRELGWQIRRSCSFSLVRSCFSCITPFLSVLVSHSFVPFRFPLDASCRASSVFTAACTLSIGESKFQNRSWNQAKEGLRGEHRQVRKKDKETREKSARADAHPYARGRVGVPSLRDAQLRWIWTFLLAANCFSPPSFSLCRPFSPEIWLRYCQARRPDTPAQPFSALRPCN